MKEINICRLKKINKLIKNYKEMVKKEKQDQMEKALPKDKIKFFKEL